MTRKQWFLLSARSLVIIGGILFIYSTHLQDDYAENLPRKYDAVSQRIYILQVHSTVVYQTKYERDRLQMFYIAGVTLMFIGFIAEFRKDVFLRK